MSNTIVSLPVSTLYFLGWRIYNLEAESTANNVIMRFLILQRHWIASPLVVSRRFCLRYLRMQVDDDDNGGVVWETKGAWETRDSSDKLLDTLIQHVTSIEVPAYKI